MPNDQPLAYLQAGEGPPTIVLEAGLGAGIDVWRRLFDATSRRRHSFAYDRPGYGDSPADDNADRGVVASAERLHRLLTATGQPPPYLIVAHSLGALYAQAYARLYPAQTAGLLLLDPRPADFDRACAAAGIADECRPPSALRALFTDTMTGEYAALAGAERALAALPPLAPGIPLRVLSAGRLGRFSARYQALWHDRQRAIVTPQAGGVWQIVDGGHYLQLDAPKAVLKALDAMLQAGDGSP